MANAERRTSPAVIQELAQHPEEFAFFQAVRLLLQHHAQRPGGAAVSLGDDRPVETEPVRLRSAATLAFPAAEVGTAHVSLAANLGPGPGPSELSATFCGLVGPQGVLPLSYTSHVIDQAQTERADEPAPLRDFCDVFQHRALSFFYRAWQKYRLPFAFEHAQWNGGGEDLFTTVLRCLTGIGFPSVSGRMSVPDEAILYYSGHFAHFPRSGVALEAVLRDYFQLPAQVEQFVGQWLRLDARDRSRLGPRPLGHNCRLGDDLVVGTRVWNQQTKFRVSLGPLSYAQFHWFMPGEAGLQQVVDLVRLFAGEQFDFDVQLILKKEEVPRARVGFRTDSRLGWNAWMRISPRTEDAREAVFHTEWHEQRGGSGGEGAKSFSDSWQLHPDVGG